MAVLIKRTLAKGRDLDMEITSGELRARCTFKDGKFQEIEMLDPSGKSAGRFHFEAGKYIAQKNENTRSESEEEIDLWDGNESVRFEQGRVIGDTRGAGTVHWGGDTECHTQINGKEFLNLYLTSGGLPVIRVADSDGNVTAASIEFGRDLVVKSINEHNGRDVYTKTVDINDHIRSELRPDIQRETQENLERYEALKHELHFAVCDYFVDKYRGQEQFQGNRMNVLFWLERKCKKLKQEIENTNGAESSQKRIINTDLDRGGR